MQTRILARWFTANTLAALGLVTGIASAQQTAPMSGMNMSQSTEANSPSVQAFKDADQSMMQKMQTPTYTGDADKDFVAHMIPHHQGAIDMAQVELKYGKDPEMQKLARSIVKAQKEEIATMKRWQAKHGSK
ncbi:DUF305 domain-containing protein [Burkholderia cepacia]|uniref:DUF305 domain-containing protein n=1 Tax=Burkholderia cepacia TaxID=292 RepID=A0AAX2RRN9_BURCE|nr:DUF305 domain-containing protein [Burkholderia cepacia]TES60872.1 DUF305 domain-containing protein [Burkholderia cepacia]TET01589.1 DUF305 domain-containing protein [Burkholderia cepacia]TEU47601.1 DUF305 domain-containing protein [Burkholderia cepacia]TEU53473.1 DUF305 domain-containing protein [Burkholderia cepacia]TEV02079.1 DUF305 domain-containing protein [Burkholderia cepacia]